MRDFIPNDVCIPVNNLKYYASLQNATINSTIDGRWTPQESGWGYTVSLWININETTCFTMSPKEAR